AVSATGNVDQRTQTGISDLRQILQTDSDDGAILPREFRNVGDRTYRHNLHKSRDLRIASVFAKERVDEFESNADARQVLVRILTSNLVRVQYGEGRRRAFFFVGQVMIGDDYVETIVARPVKRLVCANAAIDADDEFVTIGDGFFECGLLNSVTFGEAMRDVKACVCAEEFQCAQEHGGAGRAVNVVVTVDQNGLTRFDCAFETRDG